MAFDRYADVLAENETLRQELATSEAVCASAMAENVALTEDLAMLDDLRGAVRHLLDLFDSGNVLGTIAAIPGLRDALDGGT